MVVVEDVFGLTKASNNPFAPVNNTRWKFRTTPQKIEAFQQWLNQQVASGAIKIRPGDTPEQYWRRYIQMGYAKGAGRSFDDVMKKGVRDPMGVSDFYRGSKEEFLRSSFAHEVAQEKVELLAGRVYTDLKGVTEQMAAGLTRELTDGLVQGLSPREVARRLSDTVEGIGRKRALTIARTETIRAHAEGQLDALEALGVDEIGVSVEWSTTGDRRVCPLCRPLEGIVMSIKEARGLLPRHPNCRCAYIPANVGESKADQKRGKFKIEKALDKSIKAEPGKGSLAEKKDRSYWTGADRKIKKKRPDAVLKGEIN